MRADIYWYEIGTRRDINMVIMLSIIHYKLLLVDGESNNKQILGILCRGNRIEV